MTAADVAGSLVMSKCERPKIQDNKRNSGTSGADYRDDDDAGGLLFRRRRVETGRAGGSGWRQVFMFDAASEVSPRLTSNKDDEESGAGAVPNAVADVCDNAA